jgi:hypothetical protein
MSKPTRGMNLKKKVIKKKKIKKEMKPT